MRDRVVQGLFGDAVDCQPHRVRNTCRIGLLPLYEIFFQRYIDRRTRSESAGQGQESREKPLAESRGV